jgi:kinetochore protein Spc7/SPC105
MATEADKENITDGFMPSITDKPFSMSPKRSKKSRSLSMGPASSSILKENGGNRRKVSTVLLMIDLFSDLMQSAFPSVKSILSGAKDTTEADVKKRKEARRKSLANRRVSFAPEATLHTWDVIEYMKDATTSSASSESERRASAVSQELSFKSPEPESPDEDVIAESPSTPPKQVDEPIVLGSSPANQRDLHQKKRRRSSTGTNLKGNEDVFSSSPLSGSSPVKESGSGDSDSDDMGDATMDLDDPTAQSIGSGESLDSTSSSARLDTALKQASVYARTQHLNTNDDGDATMDLADDEVTNAFKPWVQKNRRDSLAVHRMVASEDQENIHPFSVTNGEGEDGDITQDVSMDITRAIGGIVQEDINGNATKTHRGFNRRRSSNLGAITESSGSPVQRRSTRRSLSRRRSSAEESFLGDETMDLTVAAGSIQPKPDGRTNQQQSPDTSTSDETMDFTVAIGGIKESAPRESIADSLPNTEILEDMSMELTENLGKALSAPAIPSPAKPKLSPRKSVLPPSVTVDRPHTPQKSPLGLKNESNSSTTKRGVQPSPRRSARKSMRPDMIPQVNQNKILMASKTLDTAVDAILEGPVGITTQTLTPTIKTSNQSVPTIEVKSVSKATSITDTLKLLLTPRKEILPSPALLPPSEASRSSDLSPKKIATPNKNFTPKRALTPQRSPSPRKRVRIAVSESPEKPMNQEESSIVSEIPEEERISLQDFLSMTNIRFLDLTTTKRRATGHPGAEGMFRVGLETDDEDQEPSLENNVAAAVSIVPMLSMYQHVSCKFLMLIDKANFDSHVMR